MSMPKRVRARTWRPPLSRPAEAQTPQKQHARLLEPGRAAIRRQHPPSRERGAEDLCPGVASSHSGYLRGTGVPDQQPGRILIPGDGAAGIRRLRTGPPARRWRLRDACALSRLNDFLAPCYYPRMASKAARRAEPNDPSGPWVVCRGRRRRRLSTATPAGRFRWLGSGPPRAARASSTRICLIAFAFNSKTSGVSTSPGRPHQPESRLCRSVERAALCSTSRVPL